MSDSRLGLSGYCVRSKGFVDSVIRVDHAGEYAAVCIYSGQEYALKNTAEAHKISEMKKQEQKHFKYFNGLVKERKVRPTVFLPIWHVMGVALGYVTAKMGKNSAMACTEAIEEVICEHYQSQILGLDDSEIELKSRIAQFRDEESEHREVAIEEGARSAVAYKVLSSAVKGACKIGIAISKVL